MRVNRYFIAEKVTCKPWETIIEKYESEGYDVEVEFNLSYPDADISIGRKKELQDTLRSKGEPTEYSARLYVRKEYLSIERVTDYHFWFWTTQSLLQITSHDLELINRGFDLAKQILNLQYCDKKDLPTANKEKIVFLAHSFDEMGNAYALRLSKFLDLLGFNVLSGQGFSPKAISRKVKERLQIAKLILVVFSEKKDTTWLIQEAAIKSEGKPVIVLIEDGVEWEPGLHGDIEFIKFPRGNIEASFIGILEGLDDQRFIDSYRRKTSDALNQIEKSWA